MSSRPWRLEARDNDINVDLAGGEHTVQGGIQGGHGTVHLEQEDHQIPET